MRRPICRQVRQSVIPVLKGLPDGFASSREFRNLLINGGKDSLSRCANIATRRTTRRANTQESGNVSQRESEAERLTHKQDAIHGRRQVLPIPGVSACQLREQSEAFVVSNRVGAHPGTLRHLANAQRAHRNHHKAFVKPSAGA
jgi:hypothetical protein